MRLTGSTSIVWTDILVHMDVILWLILLHHRQLNLFNCPILLVHHQINRDGEHVKLHTC